MQDDATPRATADPSHGWGEEYHAQFGKLWWALPASTIVVLTLLVMIFGGPEQAKKFGTSYDASHRGFRAAFLLLDELHYPVTRARRLGMKGPATRWLLFPKKSTKKDVDQLDRWVRQGGILLFADDSTEFARAMGIELAIDHRADDPGVQDAQGLGAMQLKGGSIVVDWPASKGLVHMWAGAEPIVTAHRYDQGEIWLLHRPALVTNELLREADNGVLVCRLAQAMLEKKSGTIGFDEYFHDMRDYPGVTELLFERPAIWGTVHALLLLGLLLWHYVPRFGTVRPPEVVRRRSREEFLEAMAILLERKKDYAAAYLPLQARFRRELEKALSLTADVGAEQLVAEASLRRRIDGPLFLRLLTQVPQNTQAFLEVTNELERARDEFFAR